MKKYTIGQVSKLLDVKSHVIRYWEKEFDFLSPAKSVSGRRMYNGRELNLLYRLKYLLYSKRYTIEGAKKSMWAELTSHKPDAKVKIHEIRDQLLNLMLKNKR
ncbi:MAG: MerR family transcriptional regulator [Spirochaetales bacterium]|nr:MerR family transcriptional regulator [Spirochaetales bacterium]